MKYTENFSFTGTFKNIIKKEKLFKKRQHIGASDLSNAVIQVSIDLESWFVNFLNGRTEAFTLLH